MNGKPLIGLNADYRSARKDSPAFSYLCAGYYDSLVKAGAIPVIIPPLADLHDIRRVLSHQRGVGRIRHPQLPAGIYHQGRTKIQDRMYAIANTKTDACHMGFRLIY